MGTNPNNLVGTNGAYGGRTSVNALNDVLSAFTTAGVVSGWNCAPQSGMVVQLGGDSLSRDVAIAEDPFGNRTTVNNREGEPVPVEISAASATTQRIDCVVAYVNSPATVQSTTLDNPEAVGIIDVKGSASSEPDDEAIRAAITADGGTGSTAYYVILATITVPAGATSITAGEIAQGAATMTEILANSVKSDNIDWATIEQDISGSISWNSDYIVNTTDFSAKKHNNIVSLGGNIQYNTAFVTDINRHQWVVIANLPANLTLSKNAMSACRIHSNYYTGWVQSINGAIRVRLGTGTVPNVYDYISFMMTYII